METCEVAKADVQLPMALDLHSRGTDVAKKHQSAFKAMTAEVQKLCSQLKKLDTDDAVAFLNEARRMLHEASPFRDEPVDLVLWVKNETVHANDYNPNSVAPPEMKLLEHSITEDGYTQPIVSWQREEAHEVVDGFHRHRVGKESEIVRSRVLGYLPVVTINTTRLDKGDRMAATIRHNRARGKHRVDAMSEIVIDLKRRRWSDEKIGKELGMDPDEVLRLTQVSGLAELFADRDFSQAWEADRIDEELDEG
jgi:ParB-like chromosome segregation protein Spo0J